MHHPTDRITHTTAFVIAVVEHWLEQEIAQLVHPMKDRSDDPSRHERTLLPRSYISLLHVGVRAHACVVLPTVNNYAIYVEVFSLGFFSIFFQPRQTQSANPRLCVRCTALTGTLRMKMGVIHAHVQVKVSIHLGLESLSSKMDKIHLTVIIKGFLSPFFNAAKECISLQIN